VSEDDTDEVEYEVIIGPDAADQLEELRDYLATKATRQIATGYVGRIIAYCEGLALFPHAGGSREEIRPGLKITSYQKRVTIAYVVDDDAQQVSVIGVYYGGQDWESALTDTKE